LSKEARTVRLSILGSLEVRVEGEPVRLGGPKPRAVLAMLLLHANEIVSVQRLLDAVWGERAPATGRHTLEVYVSRLRAALGTDDAIRLVARSPGYVLLVDPALVDSLRFGSIVEQARVARSDGDASRATELFRAALSLWRGPVAQDVELAPEARAEAARLDDVRLDVLEEWNQLELAAGRHSALIPDLEVLVAAHPFRDGLRAQLMLALYRAGRRTEALDVYHAGCRVLADELGLQPSAELRRLAGDVIRQDPGLERGSGPQPDGTAHRDPRRPAPRRRVATGAVVAALLVVGLVLVGLSQRSRDASPIRVALVIPGGAGDKNSFPLSPSAWSGLQQAVRTHDAEAVLIGTRGDVDDWERRLERAIRDGYDLVIAGLSSMGPVLERVAARHPEQRFAFVDGSVAEAGGHDNVAGIAFAEHEAGFLAGFLAGRLERLSSSPRLNGQLTVSAVGAVPVPAITRYLAGFRAGVRHASPEIDVLEGFTNNFVGQHLCAGVANHQIDRGSDIVFAVAGPCGLGAIAAANLRGVWAIGVDGDVSELGPHVLASATKRLDRGVLVAVEWFAQGRLAGGEDVVLDLNASGVALSGISAAIPESVRRELAQVDAAIRAGEIVVPTS
jgi:basic membrane lipoprotein Med (substrate-binding protein (PBP1-ABC) superfamily)/DNA-binding SARP family transcriptional activator